MTIWTLTSRSRYSKMHQLWHQGQESGQDQGLNLLQDLYALFIAHLPRRHDLLLYSDFPLDSHQAPHPRGQHFQQLYKALFLCRDPTTSCRLCRKALGQLDRAMVASREITDRQASAPWKSPH